MMNSAATSKKRTYNQYCALARALAADLGDRIVFGPLATSRRQVRQTAAVSAGVAVPFFALLSGILFGLGLAVSGMVNPAPQPVQV